MIESSYCSRGEHRLCAGKPCECECHRPAPNPLAGLWAKRNTPSVDYPKPWDLSKGVEKE